MGNVRISVQEQPDTLEQKEAYQQYEQQPRYC
jgi:hypothetical protein